jgi:hypothetical protein
MRKETLRCYLVSHNVLARQSLWFSSFSKKTCQIFVTRYTKKITLEDASFLGYKTV